MGLKLEHVSYLYGTDTELLVRALDDVNLEIPDGQFIGLIGHTGSGKSTLVQHLNGLLKPSEGTILFNGENIWAQDYSRKTLRSKVGLVFQVDKNGEWQLQVCLQWSRIFWCWMSRQQDLIRRAGTKY